MENFVNINESNRERHQIAHEQMIVDSEKLNVGQRPWQTRIEIKLHSPAPTRFQPCTKCYFNN